MLYSEKEFLKEMDATLDQLIQNAKILRNCTSSMFQTEMNLLRKTQDSLIAKFMHTQEYIEGTHLEETLLEKIQKLHEIAPNLLQSFSKELIKNPLSAGLRPRIGRNRKKSKIREFAYCSL